MATIAEPTPPTMANINPTEASKSFFRIDLRCLILCLCLFFVFLALANSLHAAYKVQHSLLLRHSFDTNRGYAEKLAHATNSFLESSAQALQAAALDITATRLDPAAIQNEFDQLASITDAFDAVIAVDISGKIIAAQPEGAFLNAFLEAPQARELLNAREAAAISGAFKGPGDRWMSIVAHPVFSSDGGYAGFVGGTVLLQSGSALQSTLTKLHYQEGAYFYIVDAERKIVYHPTQGLIGSRSEDMESAPAVPPGGRGTQYMSGVESGGQLISYAPIPFAGWGVVAQRPVKLALSNIAELFWRTVYYSLPLFIVSLLAIGWLSRLIANPLRQLAEVAANLDNRAHFLRIRFIKGWYLEAALIRDGLMQSFSAIGNRMRKLHREGTTDPLTGVVNRRGLETAIEELTETARDVAVVMIDVDHFKSVNDKFGHTVGDEVLKAITVLIMAEARSEDVVARMGGEEFVALLPETGLESARHFAERLRSTIEQTPFDIVGNVTISLGVACHPVHGGDLRGALAMADAALYRAKAAGRNRVHVA